MKIKKFEYKTDTRHPRYYLRISLKLTEYQKNNLLYNNWMNKKKTKIFNILDERFYERMK